MSRARLLAEMDSHEITSWQALYSLEGKERDLRALEAKAAQAQATRKR
jgi:hypothetical protein